MSYANNIISLFLAGDVMVGRGIDQVLPFHVNPVLYESYVKDANYYVRLAERRSGPMPENISYDYIWGDALKELSQENPDARVINLETAVTTNDKPWQGKSIHYRLHPKNVKVLSAAGIDVCVLANNHVMDWKRKGLKETLRTLKRQLIKTAGAGHTAKLAAKPAIVQLPSGRLLVFGYATMDSGIPFACKATSNRAGINLLESLESSETESVINHIQSIRKAGDYILFSIHWGANWGYEIPKKQRRFAHALIDAGVADIIHGHSSHHPKEIEIYRDRLILYGCGDLINDYEGIGGYEDYRDDRPLLYFVRLDTGGALHSLKIVPLKIEQFCLRYADEEDVVFMADRLNRAGYDSNFKRYDERSLQICWK